MSVLKRYFDWFLCGMIIAVALAWLFPEPGAQGGWMHPELVTKIGVALIFFLHGLLLSFTAIRQGVMQWKLHVLIQATTFMLFPVMGLLVIYLSGAVISPELKIGFFFLCALPSTVSSSVAMTAAAKGNVPVAVFNATLSSLLGIALTPLWMRLAVSDASTVPFLNVVLDLVYWLLLPLLAGQMLRPLLSGWAMQHKSFVSKVDRITILLLVYTSFCDSMKWGVWTQYGMGTVLLVAGAAMLLFCIVLAFTSWCCKLMNVSWHDRTAAVFCGSKKSLAQGVPMAQLMFAGNPALGVILMPIMIYHAFQLFVCGILAGRWANRQSRIDSEQLIPAE